MLNLYLTLERNIKILIKNGQSFLFLLLILLYILYFLFKIHEKWPLKEYIKCSVYKQKRLNRYTNIKDYSELVRI